MKTFQLLYDEKITVWTRKTIDVEADNLDEALEKLILDKNDIVSNESQEYLLETEEGFGPEENNDFPTLEIIDTDSEKVIYDNVRGKYYEKL